MNGKRGSLLRSFANAFCGILYAIKTERNFRIHLTAVFFVSLFAFLYELPLPSAALLVLVFCLVLCLELVNTALERTVDLATQELSSLAKAAKDTAAAAVLVASAGAVVCAFFLFSDLSRLKMVLDKFQNPLQIVFLVICVGLSLLFVYGKVPFSFRKK